MVTGYVIDWFCLQWSDCNTLYCWLKFIGKYTIKSGFIKLGMKPAQFCDSQ